MHFVLPEDAAKVLDACPNAEWRLIFALSRFGGLRCPSEHLALRWCDVDWERGRVVVHSTKTEAHEDGGVRHIPLFPELRPYLLEAFENAEPGTDWVITRYRHANANLRTQLKRIVKRAGLKPWPRLFHNLRSTRQTELCDRYPAHVVCAWLGNTKPVAQEHYLQVTDAHFAAAARDGSAPAASATQKATLQASAGGSRNAQPGRGARAETRPTQGVAAGRAPAQDEEVTPTR